MKTNSRLWALGLGIASLALCIGCEENQAHESLATTASPAYNLSSGADDAQPVAVPAPLAETPVPVVKNDPTQLPEDPNKPGAPTPASIVITKAGTTNSPAVAATNVAVKSPVTPAEPPRLSPALAEVVRLIQANVSQDIMLAYITNSTQPFYIGANEIVYLHDLGAPAAVVTSLINIDATPEMQSRKQIAISAKPLPPGVALTEPAANIFPPRGAAQPPPNPPEPEPVEPPPNGGSAVLSPPPPDTTVTYDYPAPATEVNYSYFYNTLSPYGTWCDVPGYGSCWRPTCATWNSSWRPYSDGGRWLWSDQGWYWYSDYSWGWAPFHYGRWCQPSGYGWVWVPDTCWGPSWVSWRYSPNYCGWAPLPPAARYVSGLGFYYNSGSVGIGFEFGLGAADYCYVPSTRFCDPHVRSYCLPAHQNVIVHKDTTVINNYVVGRNNQIINNGAGIDKIARVTRGDVKRVALKDTSSVKNLGTRHDRLESDGSTLTVYRPPSSTLARKSVVSSAGQPAVSVSRPPSAVHPAGSVRSSTVSGPAPAASTTTTPVAPAVGAGAKADANPRSGNSRTTPSPVTVYTRPTTASREPVIVTGGVEPVKPYAKPDVQGATRAERLGTETPQVANPNVAGGVRSHESTVSKDASGQTRPSSGGYSKPGTESGSASASGVSSSRTSAKPAAGSASATSSGYSAPAKSGYTRADASPAYTKPAAASSSGSSPAYTRPTTVAPSHNPSYATPSAGYVAPSRVETHHSQVAAPSGGHSGGQSSGGGSAPSVAPSGSSGGSHAKPDAPPSSGDSKKRR